MEERFKEFVALVKQMRATQKSYFKARSKGENCGDILSASKELEKKVDHTIAEYEKEKHGTQKDLF